MAPSAIALAALVHALVALALWWMAQHPSRPPATQDPVEIVFEQPAKPPPPPPKPQPAPKPEQPMPPLLGIPPPAAITADKPSQAAPKAEQTSPGQPAEAMQREPPTPKPPTLEQSVPQPQASPAVPPPEATAFAVPKPSLLRQPPQQSTPQQPAPPLPPRAQSTPPPAQQLGMRSSPLTPSPRNRPPTSANAEEPPASPFVNPADLYNRARVADNYRWLIVNKLASYVYYANVREPPGPTVVRVVIARDGRVLDVGIERSSGHPAIDQGTVAGIRWGSPYPPLPPEIKGDSATFMLPLESRPVQR